MHRLKSKLLLILALLLLPSVAQAKDGLNMSPFDIAQGGEMEVAVKYEADNPYIGFQTEVILPEGLSFVQQGSAYVVLGDVADASHRVTSNVSGNILKIVCFSTKNAVFNSGKTLFTFKVRANDTFEKGNVTVDNTIFSTQDNKDVKFGSASTSATGTPPPVTSIDFDFKASGISGNNLQLFVGESKDLVVKIQPENADAGTLVWKSSDSSIAEVDASGKVVAKAIGTTIVTVSAPSGAKATLNVEVIPTPAASITLNKTEATLKATESVDLVATILPATTTDKSVTWKSSDEAIATVDANGKVTAVAVGKATITATAASGVSASCAITVAETPASGIVIDKGALDITGDNLEMRVGDTKTINVTVEPSTTTDKSVTFTSSNPAIASVDASGKVTALALGTTTITITAKSGVSTSITVTVVATPAASITLNKTEATLKATESVDLVATILPATTTDKSVTWKSSDESIATVDANGKVTAVAVGKATITATAASGISASCAITVAETPASGIVIDKGALGITGDNLEMRVGDTKTINVTVEPSTTTDKSVTFTSSNPAIASVDASGKVTALALGTTTITITAKSGVSTSITVTVVATPAASITLNKTEATLKATESVDLVATILPATTTDKSVTWKSSDEAIATVDANGKVTAVAVGKATITATAASGVSASCAITVAETAASGIVIDKGALGITGDNLEMRVGDTKTINVTVEPATTTDKSVTFTSSNPAIASVDASGKVTALALGETNITITAKSGVSTSITVTVVATPAASISLNKTEATLKATESVDLMATILPATTTDKSVTWKSSDEAIATVDANGKVTAVAVGKATITATAASGVSASCAITVAETPASGIVIDKGALDITGDNLEMRVGDTKTINVTVEPATTTDKSVTFTSSNPAIASVDASGKVTALALGTTTITITAKSGVSTSITVTVVATPAASITLNKTEATLKATESVDLVATILPATTTDKSVTWKSSDEAIATVDANGKVTAVAVGKATITATAASGVSASCAITVAETPASGIVIDKGALGITGDNLEMRVGDTKTINVTVEPATTTDKSVSFASSNPAIASVDASGKVTALALGETTITITAKSGVSTSITVTVVATPAASISLNKTEATLKATESVDLVATILPTTTTDKSVTWKSSDEAIATVDANGKVTAIAVGKATITATTASGVSASCAITVAETPASGIVIDKGALGITGDNLEMRVGDTKTINVTVEPATTTDKSVTFTSSNPAIASVDTSGKVTAISLGTTTITITAKSGVSTSITVTVVATPAASITLNKTEATLKATESVDLVATILPSTTTDKSVTWKSSDEAIATVDANGKVTAVAVGKATITATAASGVSASCAITVAETPASGIVIDKGALGITGDNLEMRVGDTKTINVTVEPATTTDKSVSFASSNPAIASVDASGKVTAISLGTTTITITAKSGVTAQLTVKVIETPVASLTINSSAVTMKVSEYIDLEATAMPVTATDKSVTWSSSNAAVAKVDAAGRVTAMSEGSTVITATAKSGVTATCAITVLPLELNLEVSVSATKVREGSPVEYSVEASGDTQGWTYAWSRGNEVVSTDMTFDLPMTMTAGTEQATETANVKLTASYVGDNGEQWGLVEEDAPAVTVYRRPLTPSQLLRKGDGSSKTLIIMMGMTDSELAQRGYSYVYGYTDATGTDHIVATTGKRYCRIDPRVFDDASMRKWCYALWQYADGSVVTSGKRYLDGSADEDFDASTFGDESISVTPDFSNSDNWIRAVEGSVMITVDNESDTRITVHTISGAMVRNTLIPAATFGSVALDSSSLAPGIYVVSVTSGSQRSSKKVIIQ